MWYNHSEYGYSDMKSMLPQKLFDALPPAPGEMACIQYKAYPSEEAAMEALRVARESVQPLPDQFSEREGEYLAHQNMGNQWCLWFAPVSDGESGAWVWCGTKDSKGAAESEAARRNTERAARSKAAEPPQPTATWSATRQKELEAENAALIKRLDETGAQLREKAAAFEREQEARVAAERGAREWQEKLNEKAAAFERDWDAARLARDRTEKELREKLDFAQQVAVDYADPNRQMSVEAARALDCCRVCRKHPVGVPTVLAHGEEYACEACVDPLNRLTDEATSALNGWVITSSGRNEVRAAVRKALEQAKEMGAKNPITAAAVKEWAREHWREHGWGLYALNILLERIDKHFGGGQ